MRRINDIPEMKLAVLLAIAILLTNDVGAIGIAKSFNEARFAPNEELTLQYYVFNDEHRDGSAAISLEGSLKERAEVSPDKVNFTSQEELIPFIVKIDMPEKLEGDLSILVSSEYASSGQITGKVVVVQKISFTTKEEARQPLDIGITRPPRQELTQIELPEQKITFIKTFAGRVVLYVALFATLFNLLLYLLVFRKKKLKHESIGTDQVMIDYLKSGFKLGLPEKLMVSKLTDMGWSKEAIDKHLSIAKGGELQEKKVGSS